MYSSEAMEFFNMVYKTVKNEHLTNRMDNIVKLSPYSMIINDFVFSVAEIELYIELNLKETITTRSVLTADIDILYKDINGETNLEKMLTGSPPIDPITRGIYTIHHIGQKYESPFAEIPELYHSQVYYSTLHKEHRDSWRSNKQLVSDTKTEISNHWIIRGRRYL